jgi:hypothetical protein
MRLKALRTFVAIGLASTALLAQAPPVKMGLWEKTMTMTGLPSGPMTMKSKSCVTPDSWKEMVGNSSKTQPGCTTNLTKTSNGYSFVSNCTRPQGGTMTAKGSATIQDAEHIIGESHTTSTTNGKTREMEMHSTSHFLSASCGTVRPGDPEVE